MHIFWGELDSPLRATTATAFLAGIGGIFAMLEILSLPVDHSAPPLYLLYPVCSFISLVGAASIVLIPMSRDTRGIAGFVTLMFSLLLLLMDFIALSLVISIQTIHPP